MTSKLIESPKAGGWLKEQNAIGGTWRATDNGNRHDVIDPAIGAIAASRNERRLSRAAYCLLNDVIGRSPDIYSSGIAGDPGG